MSMPVLSVLKDKEKKASEELNFKIVLKLISQNTFNIFETTFNRKQTD